MKLFKRIFTDTLGYLLIILAILFGWLPFVGGIPLFVTGLSLLAVHNQWANRLLQYVKKHGVRFANAFFKDYRWLVITYDIFSAFFMGIGITLLVLFDFYWIQVGAGLTMVISLSLFLGNRKRVQRITARIKRTP